MPKNSEYTRLRLSMCVSVFDSGPVAGHAQLLLLPPETRAGPLSRQGSGGVCRCPHRVHSRQSTESRGDWSATRPQPPAESLTDSSVDIVHSLYAFA